ncbi:AraC family transcriptional regulator [Rhizobiaceae bacterium n13]|uniref:AraC family transcriptional regulator n=1 Tax=Ferirhizobium litorale TaxID=2927786 RepID=A0AAE3Q9S8_9HYPH|nr:AraC family transcriptional regulator [Fererhizobium litorale]MDI7861811.1 AraC family transcriptional regulator [Fererhizobium litorale]MDI7921847.1 AraC family transcriptional regulator [Fererhizobium litorale]
MSTALLEAVRRFTEIQQGESPFRTAIDGLTVLRSDHEKRPDHLIFKPALCIVLQGAKWAVFGGRHVDYRAGQALVVTVEMPAFGRVAEASPAEPYLGLVLEFDLGIMREVVEALPAQLQPSSEVSFGVFVSNFDGALADCVLRMVRLLDTPDAIPLLYPLIMREISYWLLTGPHGGDIARLALGTDHAHRIVRVIHGLRSRFSEPMRIEDLAETAGLSPSAFHRKFKAITSMTPLQYQKQLRLLEARRLMVAEDANVETAAFQVGYESSSQFTREYARMFGNPPRRDVAALKSIAA